MNRTYLPNGAAGIAASLVRRTALLLAFICFPPAASAGVDAVLVMDSSGSMAKNDPAKLRVPAARMFMSLLGEGDRIGLISFSDNGYPVLHLTAPGPSTNERILASADRVSSKGVYTNLHAAIVKGVDMLDREGRQGQEKMLVLMSDGKMDVGDTDEDWALTQQLQGDVLQSVQDKGIKIYTIAFTEASDTDLLREIANRSGALFKLARTDQDLHDVFSAIFESAKQPDMLPIEGGNFVVDASIEEVTIVASKEREDVRIFLESPDGRKLGAEDADDGMKWFLSHHFDMITLTRPTPGTWKLLFTGGKNRAYIVTDMQLNHNPQQPSLKTGAEMVLEAWLEQDGKLLDKEAVLTNTQFSMEIEDPNGAVARFDLFDSGEFGDGKAADGRYANTLVYENPGDYRLSIVAKGETFQRQKTVHFEVAAPPPQLSEAGAAAAQPAETPAAEPQPQAEAPAEPQAEAEPEAEPQAEPETPPQPVAEAEEGLNLGLAIGVFVGINVLLGLVGFGVWWFLKKRRSKPAAGEDEDSLDEAA